MSGMAEAEAVTFTAAFPPVDYAIRVSGNGDGMRIVLDIPESEMASALSLLAWRERPLSITVSPATRYVTISRIK